MRLITIILLLQLSFAAAFCQNIVASDLVWEADQTTDQQNGQFVNYKGLFKTNPNKLVEWVQREGTKVSGYSITGTQGEWKDVSQPGSFTYLLSRNGISARLTLERNSAGVFATMTYANGQVKFRIKSVKVNE